LVVSLSVFALANEPKKDYSKLSDAEKQEMIQNSEFEMPSPGALVSALTKSLGKIDWNSMIEKVGNKKYTSQEDMVLNLGVRGADVYFLTAAHDKSNLISISVEINNLLNKIKLNNKSLNTNRRKAKLKKIKNLVNAGKWKLVLKEINILLNHINNDFINANAEDLKLLNNAGGWIEGYRLAVNGFAKNYKADRTDILMQNDLINDLINALNNNNKLKSFDKTADILKTLRDINNVLKNSKDNKLTKQQINELVKILNATKSYL